jgi:hypothetical protein
VTTSVSNAVRNTPSEPRTTVQVWCFLWFGMTSPGP